MKKIRKDVAGFLPSNSTPGFPPSHNYEPGCSYHYIGFEMLYLTRYCWVKRFDGIIRQPFYVGLLAWVTRAFLSYVRILSTHDVVLLSEADRGDGIKIWQQTEAKPSDTSIEMALSAPAQSVSDWFSGFTNFVYEPSSDLKSNFDRLVSQRGWGRKLRNKRWNECQTFCFAALYGSHADENKLEKWQDLCREVHITDPPQSISGCRTVRCARILGYTSLI